MWTQRRFWSNGKAHPPSADPFLPSCHNHCHHYHRFWASRKSCFLINFRFLVFYILADIALLNFPFCSPVCTASQLFSCALLNFCIFSFVLRPLPTSQICHFSPKTYFGSTLHSSVNLYFLFVVFDVSSFKQIPIFGILPSFSKSILLQKLSKNWVWFSSFCAFQFVIFWTYSNSTIPILGFFQWMNLYQNQDMIWSSLQTWSKDYKGLHRVESLWFSGEVTPFWTRALAMFSFYGFEHDHMQDYRPRKTALGSRC